MKNSVLRLVITMKHSLEKLVRCPEGELKFTDNQVQLLLGNIGNLDPVIRDDLVYTLFARGFLERAFTHEQEQTIINTFIKEKNLFKDIAKPQNDNVFLRSFSALLGSVILENDREKEILQNEQRKQLFALTTSCVKKITVAMLKAKVGPIALPTVVTFWGQL